MHLLHIHIEAFTPIEYSFMKMEAFLTVLMMLSTSIKPQTSARDDRAPGHFFVIIVSVADFHGCVSYMELVSQSAQRPNDC